MNTYKVTIVFENASMQGDDSKWEHLRVEIRSEMQGESEDFDPNHCTEGVYLPTSHDFINIVRPNAVEEVLITGGVDPISLRKNAYGELSSYIMECGEWVERLPKENCNIILAFLATFANSSMHLVPQ